MAIKRININFDEDLLQSVDEYANQMHVNRSAAICFIVSTYLESRKNMVTVSALMKAYEEQQGKAVENAPLLD